jgi:hypothetical protein
VAEGLSAEALDGLVAGADTAAKALLAKTATGDLEPGKSACELVVQMKGKPGPSCTALAKKYRGLQAREQAKAKAQSERCESLQTALNQCLSPCLEMDLFDPRSEGCESGCKRRYPMTGCE